MKFGSSDCAAALELLFSNITWANIDDDEKKSLQAFGVREDAERKKRYNGIYDALQINPDLKLNSLDLVLPLPPAKLPAWSGVEDAVTPESTGRPTY